MSYSFYVVAKPTNQNKAASTQFPLSKAATQITLLMEGNHTKNMIWITAQI
jgi:hypothetical protein